MDLSEHQAECPTGGPADSLKYAKHADDLHSGRFVGDFGLFPHQHRGQAERVVEVQIRHQHV